MDEKILQKSIVLLLIYCRSVAVPQKERNVVGQGNSYALIRVVVGDVNIEIMGTKECFAAEYSEGIGAKGK